MKKILILMGVLMLFLVGCSQNSENNGYSEGIKNMKEAVNENQEDEFLLYFYATSCPHCQKMKPVLNKYAEEVEGALPVYAYDLDDKSIHDYANYFVDKGLEFEGTPTTYHFVNGEVVETIVGAVPLDKIPVRTLK